MVFRKQENRGNPNFGNFVWDHHLLRAGEIELNEADLRADEPEGERQRG